MPGMTVTEQHLKRARIYLANYQDYGKMPSVLRMARMMGVNRKSLVALKANPPAANERSAHAQRKRDLIDVLELAHDMQHDILIEGGLDGSLNSNIVKLALGKHGYSDKQELAGDGGGPIALDTTWTVKFVKPETANA